MATPKYTRQHYEDVAEILKGADAEEYISCTMPADCKACAIGHIQDAFERLFKADNPRFDLERFRKAAEEGS